MRIAVWIAAASAACYSPSPNSGAPCDPAAPNCPDGQTCMVSGGGGVCSEGRGPGGEPDAPVGTPQCFGTGLIKSLCVTPSPDSLTINAPRIIDTAVDCTSIELQPGGPALCVHAYEEITIGGNGVVTARGPNALVLVAREGITVIGMLDASGIAGLAPPAGARTQCGMYDGKNGTTTSGAGGGAGGAFLTAGGRGGNGASGATAGGMSASMQLPAATGGCAGGRGGHGGGGAGGGVGGSGGGVIYLIAEESITVTGMIAAAGGGGGGSTIDASSGGGGGGGGAGGLIGLDTPDLSVTGMLVANGGGGGGGQGNAQTEFGKSGGESTGPTVPSPGGAGGEEGGAGGAGFAKSAAPGNGGVGVCLLCGGGGGGGGAGAIRVFRATLPVGGVISPAPM